MPVLRHLGLAVGAAAISATATLLPVDTGATAQVPAQFAEQGRAAGLTESQVRAVQKATQKELSATGGRQSALNEISVDGGTIKVPVPGHKYAMDLAASAKAHKTVYEACRRGNFCGWKGPNGTGVIWQRGKCGVYHEIPDGWNSGGSWRNYQSDGLEASFHNKKYDHLSTTPPAPTPIYNGNWAPVWYVRAC